MEDFEKMYAILCGAISDALDQLPILPENILARCTMEKGLHDAEEVYITTGDMEIKE